jgi:uncharacterized cupredoxin-like copper-binding protein
MLIQAYFKQTIARFGLISALALVMLLALAACGAPAATTDQAAAPQATTAAETPAMPGMDEATMTAPPASSDSNTTTAPAATPEAAAGGSVTEVQATLREWGLDLSTKEVAAGTVRFVVTNTGRMAHNLTVSGLGGTLGATPNFPASAGAQTLEVTLAPGTYTVFCSLPGHAQQGQTAQLVVK